jgi:Bacterial pre-peptidase C-terminal domain
MIKNYLSYAVAAAFLAASGISNVAFADAISVNELEAAGTAGTNDTLATAQKLTIGATGEIIQVIGTIGLEAEKGLLPIPDVDYYWFQGQAGDLVTIDLDGGSKTFSDPLRSLDSLIVIFDPNGVVLAQVNNAADGEFGLGTDDPESIAKFDPRLKDIYLPVTGRYTVGVTSDAKYVDGTMRVFVDQGGTSGNGTDGFRSTTVANGRYTLVISGVSVAQTPPPPPAVLQVSIDIKPNAKSITTHANTHGKIPVAIKTSSQFDALKADRGSIKFGPLNGTGTTGQCNKNGTNLLCHFDKKDAGFGEGDTMGMVSGTIDGKPFEGKGWLKVIPVSSKE